MPRKKPRAIGYPATMEIIRCLLKIVFVKCLALSATPTGQSAKKCSLARSTSGQVSAGEKGATKDHGEQKYLWFP